MSYNAKNYTEQGGEKTVIGGSLEIKEGAIITGLPTPVLPIASETVLGGIKAASKAEADTVPVKIDEAGLLYVPTYPSVPAIPMMDNQVDSVATEIAALVLDFNALLLKLKTSGLMVDAQE